MSPRRGRFIVLEGPDRSGKSTQAALLVRRLRRLRRRVVHTREPGGTPFAEAVRRILLDTKHRVHPMAELFLYEAARAQHAHETLLPALRSGAVVICERYTMATLAYQGRGRGLGVALCRRLNRAATGGLSPDLTIVLDAPGKDFHRRVGRSGSDRLEREPARFRRAVRDAYRSLARQEPRTRLLDAQGDVGEVHERIFALVRLAI